MELVSDFRLQRDGSVGFLVRGYDPARELVIDPVLSVADYIGGDTEDMVYGVAAVPGGYWLVGATGSTVTIPSTITPFQAAARRLSRHISGPDHGQLRRHPRWPTTPISAAPTTTFRPAIAAAPDGTLAIVGSTYSKDFPVTTTTAFQATWGGSWNAFVLKFDPSQASSSQLVYASFYGGTDTRTTELP